ncbi:hypothetical protein [Paenarthrobacter sp. YJN-5]|uniref:hypothetical protein n=1 Tax=Paenarthrobacter sp. YJN-5 TaxID=2735316 RepID=UPI0018788274|nr:hypothetical protein [Paenarthrobacter sp. YJN-5]QOT19763.1 hypothetical protein HMI59_24195 [Paenarthrobacter sp. YJN-5]
MVVTTQSTGRLINDWTFLDGSDAEIVREGKTVVRGIIDGVTEDGSIIWVRDNIGYRRLYERCEHYEVWVSRGHAALNFQVAKTGA